MPILLSPSGDPDRVAVRRAGHVDSAADPVAARMRADLAAVAGTAYEAVLALAPPLRDAAMYHFNWAPPDAAGRRSLPCLPGKGLRARLCLISAALVGGDRATAVPHAAAVELTHNFTLVVDDVMDQDGIRRGRPTVWARFGRDTAILLGIELYAVAIELLAQRADAAAVRRLVHAGHALSGGQHDDLGMAGAAQPAMPSAERWTAMAEAKTGALFGCAMALGGLAGGAGATTADKLDRSGRLIGVAFQIVDDLLRGWGDQAQSGKPVVHAATGNLYPPLAALLTHSAAHPPGPAALTAAVAATRPSVDGLLGRALALVGEAGVDRAAITEFSSLVVNSANRVH